jgi:hypothetical protein
MLEAGPRSPSHRRREGNPHGTDLGNRGVNRTSHRHCPDSLRIAPVGIGPDGLEFLSDAGPHNAGNRHSLPGAHGRDWPLCCGFSVCQNHLRLGVIAGDLQGGILDVLYFSITTYTTLGFGDLYPRGSLRLIAGIESLNGLVLIGWSASFTHLSMEKFWSDAIRQRPGQRDLAGRRVLQWAAQSPQPLPFRTADALRQSFSTRPRVEFCASAGTCGTPRPCCCELGERRYTCSSVSGGVLSRSPSCCWGH